MAEFAETAVLIDVMNGDNREAAERLDDFLPNELRDLIRNTGTVQELAEAALQRKEES